MMTMTNEEELVCANETKSILRMIGTGLKNGSEIFSDVRGFSMILYRTENDGQAYSRDEKSRVSA